MSKTTTTDMYHFVPQMGERILLLSGHSPSHPEKIDEPFKSIGRKRKLKLAIIPFSEHALNMTTSKISRPEVSKYSWLEDTKHKGLTSTQLNPRDLRLRP